MVTSHLVEMGNNSELSLKHLSWKLATIFAITCPKRVSSLAHLNHCRLAPELLMFTLFKTKTTGWIPHSQKIQSYVLLPVLGST